MDKQTAQIKADRARVAFRTGNMSLEKALAESKPFVELYNKKAKELAKKYNQRPKLMTARNWLRQSRGIQF